MAQTRGYYTGGTVHRHQQPDRLHDLRSPRYAGHALSTDIAKMAEAPIFHVNADDPEVCLLAIEMAMEYRKQFHRDVFIDLVCFRRLGHSEADEPMITHRSCTSGSPSIPEPASSMTRWSVKASSPPPMPKR
jgi:2-oxoglutarate dehydrogenase E1 component